MIGLSEEEIKELCMYRSREEAVREALRLQRERIADALRALHNFRRCGVTCDCLDELADRLERDGGEGKSCESA